VWNVTLEINSCLLKKLIIKWVVFVLKWKTFIHFVDLKIIIKKIYMLNVNMYNIKTIIRKKKCIQQIK